MKGVVENIKKDAWKDVPYYHVKIAGNDKDYSCWQKEFASVSVGQEITFDEEEKGGRWRLKMQSTGGGAGAPRGMSPEQINNQLKSFAMSYAKDMTIAAIAARDHDFDEKAYMFKLADDIYTWFMITGKKG